MATDNITTALFGGAMLPEDMQQQLINQRAKEFATLTPSQQLGILGYKAGAGVGQGLAQAMGVDITDPALKRQAELTQLAQGVEGTPEGLRAYAKKLEATNRFQKEAVEARMLADTMEQKQSVTYKNLHEATTTDQRNYAQAKKEGYTGGFNQWLLEQGANKATRIGFSPEIRMTDKELDWRKQFLQETSPVTQQGANVRQALSLLQQQDSPFADAAFKNTVVSAFGGDKQKSKAEIDRLVNTGDLEERLANTLKGFLEGTTSVATKEDQLKVLTAIDKGLEKRYTNSADSWSKRLTSAKVNPELVVPGYNEIVGGSTTKTAALPPEGTRLRNKTTGKIEVVRNGKLVPE